MTTVSVKPELLLHAGTPRPSDGFEADILESLTFEPGTRIHLRRPTGAAVAEPPAPQAQTRPWYGQLAWPVLSLAAVVLAGLLVAANTDDTSYSSAATAINGLSIFAAIYAAAQAIERLLEPLASWSPLKDKAEDAYAAKVGAADRAVADWAADMSDPNKEAAQTAMRGMAKAKAELDGKTRDRGAIYWALASVVGMVAAAVFHLYLLKLVGIRTVHDLDVFATGLVVGAGTKPLHDLITNLQSGSGSQEAKAGGTTTNAVGS